MLNETPKFPLEEWNSAEVYADNNIVGYEPMTAKELDTEEKQNEVLNSSDYYIEEKFDGTRALVYLMEDSNRVFSRRISKKTGFYVENTDSLPHIRDKVIPYLDGTILDGEMFIPQQGFQVSSAVMNCKYDKAIERQKELGFQVFHAFDILFFKGKDLRNLPLKVRKIYLNLVITSIGSPYFENVVYQSCGRKVSTLRYESTHGDPSDIHFNLSMFHKSGAYPNFFNTMSEKGDCHSFTPRAFYEYIVATGGEGVIIKPKDGKYLHKRGWEYSKIKAFLTRELVLIGFTEPTREYTGKAPEDWEYYENGVPVTKYYYNSQVGNMRLGVVITDEEYNAIPKNKRGVLTNISNLQLMEVCECGGYNDELREELTKHKFDYIGKTVEIKANGVMKDSGRMRHPRFLRFREDKNPDQCVWKDHIM